MLRNETSNLNLMYFDRRRSPIKKMIISGPRPGGKCKHHSVDMKFTWDETGKFYSAFNATNLLALTDDVYEGDIVTSNEGYRQIDDVTFLVLDNDIVSTSTCAGQKLCWPKYPIHYWSQDKKYEPLMKYIWIDYTDQKYAIEEGKDSIVYFKFENNHVLRCHRALSSYLVDSLSLCSTPILHYIDSLDWTAIPSTNFEIGKIIGLGNCSKNDFGSFPLCSSLYCDFNINSSLSRSVCFYIDLQHLIICKNRREFIIFMRGLYETDIHNELNICTTIPGIRQIIINYMRS